MKETFELQKGDKNIIEEDKTNKSFIIKHCKQDFVIKQCLRKNEHDVLDAK